MLKFINIVNKKPINTWFIINYAISIPKHSTAAYGSDLVLTSIEQLPYEY